jgi:inner membrane transporter RhtA
MDVRFITLHHCVMASIAPQERAVPLTARRADRLARAAPPQAYFLVSAIFHYLGPSFAVLLFARLDVLGVAWLRIASAAVVFGVWRRPWTFLLRQSWRDRWVLIGLGVVLGVMNSSFYLAIARLPLATVGAIEFLGPIALAVVGMRTRRNFAALALAVTGVYLLTTFRLAGQPLGFAFAFANCALFVLYIVLAHRIAQRGAQAGIDGLGAAMLIALIVVMPVGLVGAAPAFVNPLLLGAGIGVGICSSVIPYVTDQLAMARLSRPTYALLLSLLPATATIVGLVVLRQVPTIADIGGVGLVVAGIAIHREPR